MPDVGSTTNPYEHNNFGVTNPYTVTNAPTPDYNADMNEADQKRIEELEARKDEEGYLIDYTRKLCRKFKKEMNSILSDAGVTSWRQLDGAQKSIFLELDNNWWANRSIYHRANAGFQSDCHTIANMELKIGERNMHNIALNSIQNSNTSLFALKQQVNG